VSNNADRRVSRHTLLDGIPRFYRANLEPYTGPFDGSLIVGNGMEVIVEACFHTWNGVEGLDMLYVYCPATGKRTHVTPADIGWTTPLLP
jgi:hypothetical protein